MTIKKFARHRNGICGTPFTVGIIEEQGETVLIVQFDDKIENTAAFNLDKLSKEIIEFGQNSKRGDYYCDEFKRLVALEENSPKGETHCEECIEYNQKYEADTPGICICEDCEV